jgi:integrase
MELMTGLRRGELFGLKWSDIYEEKGEVQIRRSVKYLHGDLIVTNTKTNSGKRKIMLAESVKIMLMERHKVIDSEWVFPKENDNSLPYDPKKIFYHIQKVLAKAELPYVQFHNLRHTFATQAIFNGVEPTVLSNLMGHKIITFTLDTYTHGTIDMQKNMANIIDSFMTDVMGEN